MLCVLYSVRGGLGVFLVGSGSALRPLFSAPWFSRLMALGDRSSIARGAVFVGERGVDNVVFCWLSPSLVSSSSFVPCVPVRRVDFSLDILALSCGFGACCGMAACMYSRVCSLQWEGHTCLLRRLLHSWPVS